MTSPITKFRGSILPWVLLAYPVAVTVVLQFASSRFREIFGDLGMTLPTMTRACLFVAPFLWLWPLALVLWVIVSGRGTRS